MGSCYVFCAGACGALLSPPGPGDCILAADGGLAHVQRLGLTPDRIVGDFDSLGYIPGDARVYPVEKDDTDAMLCARMGLEMGFRRFLFYGALDGPRLDHTVANFQTLEFLAERGAVGYLVGTRYLATVLRDGELCFRAGCRGIVSVFCLGADAEDVSIRGLHYPLEHGRLTAGYPLGVSNHFQDGPARIRVGRGSLLVLWDVENGLPAGRVQADGSQMEKDGKVEP